MRIPTLPAISAGAAKRKTCQKGKFHGITARTGPSGIEADVAARRVRLARLRREEGLGVLRVEVARHRALLDLGLGLHDRLAHLERHGAGIASRRARAATRAAARIFCARVANGTVRHVEERLVGGGQQAIELLCGGLVEAFQDLAGRWIDGLHAHREPPWTWGFFTSVPLRAKGRRL